MRDIKVLHLEPTDVCQAACPLCARETDSNFNKTQQHHLTMNQILQAFGADQIAQLDKMFMCGNYGDPAAGKFTLEIYQQFRQINPTIVLGMNTNGAIQNPDWWQKLGNLFSHQQDYVVFSIDGLEDTNHIYRKGVNWDRLIKNASAFISTGGSAHWDMLVYRHNEHQVDACQQLAKELGFRWFRAKVSKRPLSDGLERPLTWPIPTSSTQEINCHALNEKSIYIDAQGRISPCCWLGSRQTNFVTDFQQIQMSWQTNTPNTICRKTCGTTNNQTMFDHQWRREVELSR